MVQGWFVVLPSAALLAIGCVDGASGVAPASEAGRDELPATRRIGRDGGTSDADRVRTLAVSSDARRSAVAADAGSVVAGSGGAGSGQAGSAADDGAVPGCASDMDCPADSPRCSSAGTCSPCMDDGACELRSGLTKCDLGSGASHGQCVQCGGDQDCPRETPLCVQHACVECEHDFNCGPAAPQCVGGACGACTSDDPCSGRAGLKRCVTAAGDPQLGACVQCTGHAQCNDPTPECGADHRCVPCTGDEACAGRPGETVCDRSGDPQFTGNCVACTGTEYAGCTQGTTEYVCISARRVCSGTALEHGAGACEPCVSDAHCQQGSRCVQRLAPPDAGAYLCTATQTTCD